ncbi:hypothetical protein, partial [uncultured Corynebacterium sp.]|uniref:hypothetical protein n=1 Tax=uncultured Corynebacterium sp. TaxID=159447 RepID=UPI002636A2AD
GGGLTSIDVRHDADVADLLQVGQRFKCHWVTPLISLLSDLAGTSMLFTLLFFKCFKKPRKPQAIMYSFYCASFVLSRRVEGLLTPSRGQ